ncbi:putative protein kinase RLK-Pelle-LRR-I-1 family [Helianthus annuus]|nr:putative protein kinase RLK-Pelle-LRR-I-1 family [Helianthus annuus]
MQRDLLVNNLEKLKLLLTSEIVDNKDNPIMSLEDINHVTQKFHNDDCIGIGGFGRVFKGNLQDGDGFKTIVVKQLDTRLGQGKQEFLSELQMLLDCMHENVIGRVGHCDETSEKIIVYKLPKRKDNKDDPRISLEDINHGIQRDWLKVVYKGNLQDDDGFKTIVAKRLDKRFGQGELKFLREQLQILLDYKRTKRKTNSPFPRNIRLKEIISATNNFNDENLIREGGFGKDYKGKMVGSEQFINICARRLNHKYGQEDIEFQTKISMLSSLEHKNIIPFLGFCNEDNEKIIVYEHAVRGSLDQHLNGPNLTWFQRLKICLDVARVLSSIHYDVVHCDINSSNIFLDKDWEPKIFGFEHSTKYPQSWRHRLLFSHHSNNTYMTPKYDVYCFGVLLFEVLYGIKPVKTQHCVKVEHGIINPKLWKQMDRQSLTRFTKIIDNCLNEDPVQRPTMDQIVKELDDVFELQWKHENLEHSTDADADEDDPMKMEWLKIPLSDIREATNGFDKEHFVASGGYGSVYQGELDVLAIEGEGPKIRTRRKVAIKCINNRQDEASKQGFLTEIELLTRCKHPNIISLLGFYMKANDIILVYEYATKGSLSDYLGSKRKINLTWAKRIQICLDVAHGINYLHTNMEGKPRIIHRDIKSENILLDENLNAKVADFGLSKLHITNQQSSTIHTKHIAGTDFYVDPEYLTSAKYKKESDVYSFGVVLFEMLSGRLAYDPVCIGENDKGLAPIARRRYNEGTLKELIDPKMIEEDDERIVTLNRGPNEESFQAFSRIAYQCLAETQAKRPTMEAVIKELQTTLNLQLAREARQ